MAKEAITGYLEALKADGEALPGGRGFSEEIEIAVPA